MNEDKVKTLLNMEVLEQIQNYPVKQILKSILFSPSNTVDWDQAYTFIMTFMPELNLYDGYKVENMMKWNEIYFLNDGSDLYGWN